MCEEFDEASEAARGADIVITHTLMANKALRNMSKLHLSAEQSAALNAAAKEYNRLYAQQMIRSTPAAPEPIAG